MATQNWKITATNGNQISKCLSILLAVEPTFKKISVDFVNNTAIVSQSHYSDLGEHPLKVCSRNGERFIFEKVA